MTALNEKLRLEVFTGALVNLVANHSGQDGATSGWSIDSGYGTGITATSGNTFGRGGKTLRVTATGSSNFAQVTTTNTIPVTPGQFVGATFKAKASRALTAGGAINAVIQYFNSSNPDTLLRADVMFADFTPWDGSEVEVRMPSLAANTGAPATANRARLLLGWTAGSAGGAADFHWWDVMVVAGSSKSAVVGFGFSDTDDAWQNVLPSAISVNTVRGGDVDGVVDKLEVGTMTAVLTDPAVTPENNSRVRPGWPVRLMGLVDGTWTYIYRGKINQAVTTYPGDTPRVTITASDGLADLENTPQVAAKSGRFKQRVDAALAGTSIQNVTTDTASDSTSAIISVDEQGTALSQLTLARNSLRGLFYVDKANIVRAFAANSYPSQSPTVTLSDSPADSSAIRYLRSGMSTSFDSKNLVNTLTVNDKRASLGDQGKVYGPYINLASVNTWGTISAEVTVNDGTPATLATAYLAVTANPAIFTDQLSFNATDDIGQAVKRELYEAATVKYAAAGVNTTYRIIGIEHSISAHVDGDEWITRLRFKPLETASTVTVTNPPGGAAAGPKDQVPVTTAQQSGQVSITTTGTTSNSVNVTFKTPYPGAPRVVATAKTTAPRDVVAGTGDPTASGVAIYAQRSASGTTKVDWIATYDA